MVSMVPGTERASRQATSGTPAAQVQPGSRPAATDVRVGVVILTYNRLEEVSRTVERMLALPERPHVVVVDNGSTDGTPDLLPRRYPEIRCIRVRGNPGAAGRNA